MMKKRNFLYAGTLALGMFMSGCSDSFLDMNNYGSMAGICSGFCRGKQ